MYAFFTAWPRRQGRQGRERSRGRWWFRFTLMGSLAAGLGLLLWFSLPGGGQESRFQLAGFLGLSWQDGWAAPKEEKRVEPLPVKSQGAGEQPVYSLLHPSAPPEQAAPGKKKAPALKPLPKPKARTAASKASAKKGKTPAVAAKKEKTGAKAKAKKKKPATQASSARAAGG